MFSLDGNPTRAAIVSKVIIENSGIPIDAYANSSAAILAYRRDPRDGYLYLTAMAGVREPEPMFGPLRHNDYRSTHASSRSQADVFGFRARESVVDAEPIQFPDWHIYINAREHTDRRLLQDKRRSLERALEAILSNNQPSREPLFPELWYLEKDARDHVRDTIHKAPPGTSLEDVARRIADDLTQWFSQLAGRGHAHLGIYLDTGDKWGLCETAANPPWLLDSVMKLDNAGDAFNWVGQSTRPVLLAPPLSRVWEQRLVNSNAGFRKLLDDGGFGGACLVPILQGPAPKRCFGILFLALSGATLLPAHLFLMSRLSFAISGYIYPLLPLSGFPWWPDAKLRRGDAAVIVKSPPTLSKRPVPPAVLRMAEDIAKDLMPYRSRVTLSPMRWGHGGAFVFRLDVTDEGGIAEVPRVLKFGPPKIIREELKRYFRYAHNKVVGSDARIDIARSSIWTASEGPPELLGDEPPEAIVYTLVGAGEDTKPWSEWAQDADPAALKAGLNLLKSRLKAWYGRTRQSESRENVIKLILGPLSGGALKTFLSEAVATNPSRQEVQDLIDEIHRIELSEVSKTCIAHNDLHTDNIFALLDRAGGSIRGVALIDWGGVTSGRHPLGDISRLMADLAYRVCHNRAELRDLCNEVVADWGRDMGCGEIDWAVALIHQLAKLLFYRASLPDEPYLEMEARQAAWIHIKSLKQYIEGSRSQLSTVRASVRP